MSDKNNNNSKNSKLIDEETGFEVNENFQRFNQKNEMFNRAVWDDTVRNEHVEKLFESHYSDLATFRTVDGFTHRDYALRNAAWYVSDYLADQLVESEDKKQGFLDPFVPVRQGAKIQYEGTAQQNSIEVKQAGKFLGADLVGVCEYDERWVYASKYSRNLDIEKPADLPDDLPYVVVIITEMDHDNLQAAPSVLGSASTGYAYSQQATAVMSLAQYISNLGYLAVACINDTALSVPLAVQAGLGEYGRLGLLITKEFGPRVRISKIFTDLPLQVDKPIKFGVQEFCRICFSCSTYCPMRAIPTGEPSLETHSISNSCGVKKWTVDVEKCFEMWANQGTDCSICIRVCPYNMDYTKWHHRIGQRLAGTRLRRFMLWLDRAMGYGKRKSPHTWWGGEKA
jgi:epoxyqueuosine reductase